MSWLRELNLWVFFGDLCLVTIGLIGVIERNSGGTARFAGLPWHVGALAGIYGLIRVLQVIYKSSGRSLDFRIREDNLREVLTESHEQIFGSYAGVRYTIFTPDELNPYWIVPIARFEFGQEHCRAKDSRARYARDMGHTGAAWSLPLAGEQNALFAKFTHADRQQLIQDFERLNVPKRIAKSVSDYMLDVGGIYSFRLVSKNGLRDFGVLSIDLNTTIVDDLQRNARMPSSDSFGDLLRNILAYFEFEQKMKGRH